MIPQVLSPHAALATLVPLWAGLPIAGVMMLLVAAHALALGESDHPASRKRIRQANAVLILLAIPLITTGVCVLSPRQHPREWALVWMAAFGLIALVVALALADVLNTLRLLRSARARLRAELFSGARAQRAAGAPRADDPGRGAMDPPDAAG